MVNTRGIDRLQEQDENKVFSDNFGGLNTTASDVNVPYSDSPLLYNCDVDVSGNITKRRGTRIIGSFSSTADRSYNYFNFITGKRYSYIIEKAGIDINIYEIDNDVQTLLMTKSDVWDDLAEEAYVSIARTAEFEPRVILTTGVNKPVQLTFVEQELIDPSGAPTRLFPDPTARLEFATTANVLMYINGVRVTVTGVVWIANELAVTGPLGSTGDVVDLVVITWQHWSEALFLKGNELAERTTRTNALPIDQNVLIPETLSQQDIPNDFPTDIFSFGYVLYDRDTWDLNGLSNFQYDYDSNQSPTTEEEWASGNGAIYDNALGGSVVPSPLFATFGALEAAGNPTELLVIKRFDLLPYFNGGELLDDAFVTVRVDGTVGTQSTNAAAPTVVSFGDYAYYLFDETGAVTSQDTRFISFEAASRIGVNPAADIEIIYTTTNFIGTGATTNVNDFRDGAGTPMYGLGVFADYAKGVFPSFVEVFDNRIVLSGFSANPLLVLFSEAGDTTFPGKSYRKFQTRITDTLATDPIDYRISGITEDYITGMSVWQRSLFVFTRKSAYRVYGNDFNGLSNSTIFSNLISNQGLVNDRSVSNTEDGILYLSDSGVQRVAFGGEDDDYTTPEISINIRPEFGVTVNPIYEEQSFLVYDAVRRKVYVGLPKDGGSTNFSRRLLVYDTFRRNWTEYRTDGDFRLFTMLSYEDQTLGDSYLGIYAGFDNFRHFLKFNDERFLDFIVEVTAPVVPTIPIRHHEIVFTVAEDVYTYYIDDGVEDNFFEMIPNDDINDLYVTLQGTELIKGTDYVKHFYENSVELLSIPNPGDSLIVAKRTPVTDYEVTQAAYSSQIDAPFTSPISDHRPYHVVVDNRYVVQDTDYTINSGSGNNIILTWINTPAPDAEVYMGQYYEARYTSPLLVLGNLATVKRAKHIYAYFNNELGREQYRLSDVNLLTNQENDAIVGKYKQRLNANLDIFYESSDRSDVGVDIYSFYDVTVDFHIMDIDPSANQSREHSLFKEALLGVGYSYRIGIWSFDEATFTLSAWQITNRQGGEKFINALI